MLAFAATLFVQRFIIGGNRRSLFLLFWCGGLHFLCRLAQNAGLNINVAAAINSNFDDPLIFRRNLNNFSEKCAATSVSIEAFMCIFYAIALLEVIHNFAIFSKAIINIASARGCFSILGFQFSQPVIALFGQLDRSASAFDQAKIGQRPYGAARQTLLSVANGAKLVHDFHKPLRFVRLFVLLGGDIFCRPIADRRTRELMGLVDKIADRRVQPDSANLFSVVARSQPLMVAVKDISVLRDKDCAVPAFIILGLLHLGRRELVLRRLQVDRRDGDLFMRNPLALHELDHGPAMLGLDLRHLRSRNANRSRFLGEAVEVVIDLPSLHLKALGLTLALCARGVGKIRAVSDILTSLIGW